MPTLRSDSLPEDLIPQLVADRPRTIWIELTSKCPFDCVFCSRRQERGNGRHMSFALYESLIQQLRKPELIRLNYSGESTHYPQLGEAIRLARSTGAGTELVSALASATQSTLRALVDNGLTRLSVSIHSLDPAQFRAIYGFGEISDLRERLAWLRQYKIERETRFPEIDFAFVAMQENLSQLPLVAGYARELGVRQLSVHPVIRRSRIPMQFPIEIDHTGKLRPDFEGRVHEEVHRSSAQAPGVSITVARPATQAEVTHGISTCEQNPWETIHVLANGAVVICEVHDRSEMGNLESQSLAEIWHGEAYADFRRRYLAHGSAACNECAWRRTVDPRSARKVLLRGWHPSNAETVTWSESSAAIVLDPPSSVSAIRLTGVLLPAPNGIPRNALTIRPNAEAPVHVVNETGSLLRFEASVPVKSGPSVLRFETQNRFCPAEENCGPDLRRLGFGLADLSFVYREDRQKAVARILNLLDGIERIGAGARLFAWNVPKPSARSEAGVSVLVPARDTPELLGPALRAAEAAMARVPEPCELLAVVTGVRDRDYASLRTEFPRTRWIFRAEALHYGPAIELGLAHAQHPWVYLLNSDMVLDPRALIETLPLRAPDTFAVASRIRMRDGSRTETNWTDLRYVTNDAAELIERDPAEAQSPRGCFYVGGGSGLFRRSLLRRFIRRTRAYAPFYWEDVEWGALAWRYGYRCIFCPDSEAVHGHRRTVSRYYTDREVARVFEHNRLRFHLRNLSRLPSLETRLLSLDAESWIDLFRFRALADVLRARAFAFAAPCPEEVLFDRWKISF